MLEQFERLLLTVPEVGSGVAEMVMIVDVFQYGAGAIYGDTELLARARDGMLTLRVLLAPPTQAPGAVAAPVG